MWGVNRGGNIYRWLGSTWEQIDGAAIEVSAGNCGVWVVNSNNDIFYRVGTYGDVQTKGSGVNFLTQFEQSIDTINGIECLFMPF